MRIYQVSETAVDREHTRTGHSVDALKRAFLDNLFYIRGRNLDVATSNDLYMALAYTVRDRLLHRFNQSSKTFKHDKARSVCYFSAEYLPGPHLVNNMINLGIIENVRTMTAELGIDLDSLVVQEEEPGLGNGGLGRLAACYMDSLVTLQLPAIGYGIRYEHGIFNQSIVDGWQIESTDKWLHPGNPWEIRRPKLTMPVLFGGHTEQYKDDGHQRTRWVPHEVISGVAYDTPIPGYRVGNANLLRLWRSEAVESFNFKAFNKGDYYAAVECKIHSETLTKVLYPNDEQAAGKELRLRQQFFFSSCSLQDMIRIYLDTSDDDLKHFHNKFVIQLNDTHPAIAVIELLRLLLDVHHLEWDDAWHVTKHAFCYTNHTLLPEALEKWPVELFQSLLPRHMELIYEVNQMHLDDVRLKFHGDSEKIARLSIIDESGNRYVRMAHIACIGSSRINGVAELHSELIKKTTLKDFYDLSPEKFFNVTNGVTPRRFLVQSNPPLTDLITSRLGDDDWICHMDRLHCLEKYCEDSNFQDQWQAVKMRAKQQLSVYVKECTGISLDPASIYDIQVKRIHEYKRQHLNALHIITLYNRIKDDPHYKMVPRTFMFGGKAAPGYKMAKLLIKFITSIAEVVNRDPVSRDLLRVVFCPNFNVKRAQNIYPAADLSEQISLAGMEASGTSNMKFTMNGALTIGTLDGANIEIRDEVGHENFFLFGNTIDQVEAIRNEGYQPGKYLQENEELSEALELIRSGYFSHGDTELFKPLVDNLVSDDPYMLLADYASYISCQESVSAAYLDQSRWTRMSILNVARSGKFSSDRSIQDYCDNIWGIDPVPVEI
ncbi:glycogen phosphorylase [Solemya velum gill symbiont]|nr:glycogen phosphorylase [Solemya velum gill symbiont]OOZ00611.1 glycogen phosphorylase [Solemya velum gill symbiont]OOZ02785.1 glycogen phosphorylase [Solemya velum gill symbiont]OOZ04820.1 glycogen phosphorylase [Solemya velum gill symbiont]OOZ07061.1 glycogen phosphorylase [Solemya velum gill symbiont]